MSDYGREQMAALIKAVDRVAMANESLLAIAEKEQIVMAEPGPPVCPFCGKLDPVVTEVGEGGSGPLGDFIFVGETHCCNKTLYAVAHGWDTFTHPEMAADLMTRRAGQNG